MIQYFFLFNRFIITNAKMYIINNQYRRWLSVHYQLLRGQQDLSKDNDRAEM